MQDIAESIKWALTKEEVRAEKFVSIARLILLVILTIVALLNAVSLTAEANVMNFGALGICYMYGIIIFSRIRRAAYKPITKYVTSCLDIVLLFLLLFLYTKIEIPSVALKNYAFLAVFPLIALTAFRYNQTLTLFAGGLAMVLYCSMIFYLYVTNAVVFSHGGYERELFTADVTYVGQLTKVLILGGFVVLMSYFAQYSRTLVVKLVSDEVHLRSQKEIMDVELKIASQVQSQFLPRSFPDIPGCDIYGVVQQGKFVGGDYCDFIKVADDKFLIIIADVCGKGIPAALIMSEVRASAHVLASMHIDLWDIVQRLNRLVHQSTSEMRFVTFFAAEVNTSQRLLTYINAGHPPPMIYCAGNVRTLTDGTIPLGIFDALPQCAKKTEDFSPGSVFVSYTDGLSEQTNINGEEFGETRIREYVQSQTQLNAQSFSQKLLEELKNFAGGKDLDDDVSLAIVKYHA